MTKFSQIFEKNEVFLENEEKNLRKMSFLRKMRKIF
jgi:hypothetical protein